MCFGPAVEPPTELAKKFVTVIRVLMICQVAIVILNFVAVNSFLREAIFGIFFLLILYIAQHQISYQILMIYIFISIFFAINFMVFFLKPLQNGVNISTYSGMDRFTYAISIISFVYYLICMVFCFYPYRQFKAIAFNENPALRGYFENNQNQQPHDEPNPNEQPNTKQVEYNVNYGNINYDQKKKNNDNGTFEVFKGQGVKIG